MLPGADMAEVNRLTDAAFIARDLVNDELIVRQIVVERVDHPIAVEPDPALLVLLVTIRIGVARRIQPEPSPTLAIMRRVQQPVHLLFVCVAAAVVQKRIHLFDRRRQPDEVQAEPAQECHAIGFRTRGRSFFLQARQNELIDGSFRPGFVSRWRSW